MFNVEYEDMYRAYTDCRKRKKSTPGAKKFETYALYNIVQLTDEINRGKYKLMPSSCFVIEYPTQREVFCAAFRDRVVQHFVYNELNPVLEKLLIRDTASCRIGKGTDYAVQRVARFVRRETENYTGEAFFGKLDLSGYFMSIDRDLLFAKILHVVEHCYTGKYKDVLIYLIRIIILSDVTKNAQRICPISKWDTLPARKTLFNNPYGIAIGNITSQLFANFYLNSIDHFIKSRHPSYCRYVDDMIIVDKDKGRILETIRMLNLMLPGIHEKLNPRKSQVQNVKYGIPFLGITIKPYYNCLGRKRINRMYYTSSGITTPEDMFMSAASRKGMFERYKGYHVSRRWYAQWPAEIREALIYLPNYKLKYA